MTKEWVRLKGPQNEGLLRHHESGQYKFRKFRKGYGEIDRVLDTSDLSIARKRRDELMVQLWNEKPKVLRRQTVGELWPTWEAGKKETKSKGTADSIHFSWKNLEPHVASLFPDEVTETWWLTVYIPAKREEPSPKTGKPNPKRKFANERKWLIGFLNHLKRQGQLERLPVLPNPDPPRDRAETFSREQFARLCRKADLSLRAKLVMGRDHFMRRSEVALLSWDRVDRKKRTIHLRAEDTKIRKPRTFPYSRRLERLFAHLEAEQNAAGIVSPFVFPSPDDPSKPILRSGFYTAWRNCKKRAGVPGKMKFHWLRHTGLTIAFRRKRLEAAQICFFAGLSLAEAQKTYLHFTADDLRGVEELVAGGSKK